MSIMKLKNPITGLWESILAIKGEKGDTGVGVPQGGTAGQVLKKTSSADYDTAWLNETSALPSIVNDRYLHTNASTGALEWSTVQGGGGSDKVFVVNYGQTPAQGEDSIYKQVATASEAGKVCYCKPTLTRGIKLQLVTYDGTASHIEPTDEMIFAATYSVDGANVGTMIYKLTGAGVWSDETPTIQYFFTASGMIDYPSEEYEYRVVHYLGETIDEPPYLFKQGHFYQCLYNEDTEEYYWEELKVQDDELPTIVNDRFLHTTSTGELEWATAYQKPSGGIPASDLASGVIPSPEVFIATYDATRYYEITSAFNSGKSVFCKLSGNTIVPLICCGYSTGSGSAKHLFGGEFRYNSNGTLSHVYMWLSLDENDAWDGGNQLRENVRNIQVSTTDIGVGGTLATDELYFVYEE